MSKEHSSVQGKKKKLTLIDKLVHLPLTLILIGTVVYGGLYLLLSTPLNKAFNHPIQCTIVGAAKGESRSKSYSGNSYVYVKTTDCPGMRYVGDRNGLTRSEVAERIEKLKGQKVTIDVGSWQLPGKGDDVIVGIEGLDLSH